MSVPDFLVWHCANCGAAAEGTKKPCGCATMVGTRKGPTGQPEQTWWDNPLVAETEQLRKTIARQSALLAQMAAALEMIKAPTGGTRGLHKDDDRMAQLNSALTTYTTMSPDPMYAEAKNMFALLNGLHTCPECEQMVGKIWHEPQEHMGDCDIGNTIKRARGEV